MLIYFSIIFTLYYFIVLLFIKGWRKIEETPRAQNNNLPHFISVIVVVRNEEKNIAKLLEAIKHQTLHKSRFELIIVNDDSYDRTVEMIQEFIEVGDIDLQLIQHEHAKSGTSQKKSAITQGVAHAKGDIIAMTDGDCYVGTHWLETLLQPFENNTVRFVSGPVILTGQNNAASVIQIAEFASLIGVGGALINLNYPLMCNGANLAFRKSAFTEVNGYVGNLETSTGDDVFLMQKIHKAFANSVKFLKKRQVIVSTETQKSWSDLINQRKRWASKWNKNLLPFSWTLPVFLFIQYLSFLFGLILIVILLEIYWPVLILVCIKFILDYIFLKKVMNFCNLRLDFSMFLLCELLYPFYAIFFGTIVHFGKYTWKGRSHKN